MSSLGEAGCFAYYFNILASKAAMAPAFFEKAPYTSTVFLLLATGLSIVASKLLLKTIDLQFSEQAGDREALLTRPPGERESVLNLPFLLQISAPKTLEGDILYFLVLVIVQIALLRLTALWVMFLYDFTKDFSGWGGLIFLLLAGSSFISFPELQGLQVLCVGLNVVYAVSNSMINSNIQLNSEGKEWDNELNFAEFGVITLFVVNQLNVPSVLAASAVSTARQSQLQTLAVVLVAALSLVLGLSIPRNEDMNKEGVFVYVRGLIFVPCAFSWLQIRMRTLVEVVTAWRYGLNVHVARERYPYRVKIVQICLPVIVALPCFILPYLDVSTQNLMFDVIALPQELTLAISIILLIIPCCYDWTVQGFSGNVDLKRVPEWWRYVAYVGGGCSLLASVYSFTQVDDSTTLWYSLYLDCGLVGGMVVWQVLGNYLG